MIARFCAAAALACGAISSPVVAQQAKAPRVENSRGQLEDRALIITGNGDMSRNDPPLRTAQPVEPLLEWFDANSALAKAHQADPNARKYARLVLKIGADGSVAGCQHRGDPPPIPFGLCDAIKDKRFLPQLANNGTAVEGLFNLSIFERSFDAQADSPLRPMFVPQGEAPPALTLAPSPAGLRRFPPLSSDFSYLYREPKWALEPHAGWGNHSQDNPKSGLIVYPSADELICRVLETAGSNGQDAAACEFAKTTLAPDWSQAEPSRTGLGTMVPLYILHQPDGLVAIGPKPDYVKRTRISQQSAAALEERLTQRGVFPRGREASELRLAFKGDETGAVTHCRVARTSGSDAGDIAACKAAYEVVRLEPREDVFGTPYPPFGDIWAANPDER